MPSSVVNSYIYFPETEVLRIIYQSGAVYDYLKVLYPFLKNSGKPDQKDVF
ncbi:KTSC domain-containing protein [Chryseobacterium sp.]|uniref:KTSC domain-containing protein n=1 Tax=Chryseobacterium sp. TaxID=1871047 RepID=UPI003455DEA5